MQQVLFKFGVIADLQYGDFGDRTNYTGSRKRYYRTALDILKRAVDVWKTSNLDFIIQMGDLIDGFNAFEFNSSQSAFSTVMSVIRENLPDTPLYHVIGNHELYNFKRCDLKAVFPTPDNYPCNIYAQHDSGSCFFIPNEKIGFLIVDNYEFSMLGFPDSELYNEAKNFLMTRNPNHHELNSPDGLTGDHIRFCKYNGSMSPDQLSWVDNILSEADAKSLNVIVAGHQPVEPNACDAACLEWKYTDFLDIIRSHKCVVGYLAGHNHDGGYCKDKEGIHHVTFQGAIETAPGIDCFAVISVFNDRFEIDGYGRVPSRVCKFDRA